MAAYVIVDIQETTDEKKMEQYRAGVVPTVQKHGGRYIAIGGPCEVKEGNWRPMFPVILEFPDLDATLGKLPVDVVFGHLGYVKTERAVAAPGFQALLRLLRGGRAWVKFTGAYRISSQALPHADTDAFARMLITTAPGRIVWGTDWPHVMTKWTIPMPNDGAIADLLLNWVPNAALRQRILAENPTTLYDFS